MKRLYIIGGPMGVGKTAACRALQKLLPRTVFLDGDWCWDADPFQVTAETRAMVQDNICHLLQNFLRCSAYDNVLFCWVLHQEAIVDALLARLDCGDCRVLWVSLTCTEAALRARLAGDIAAGRRQPDVTDRALARLPLYRGLPCPLLDTTDLTPAETAARIAALSL